MPRTKGQIVAFRAQTNDKSIVRLHFNENFV